MKRTNPKAARRRVAVPAALTAAVAIAAAPATRPVVPPAADRSPFVTVLMRDFDAWDANHDGTLSAAEIDRAVLDPAVTGDDAAVAAALKVVARSTRLKAPPLTRAYFERYAASPAAGQVAGQTAVDATIDPDRPTAGTHGAGSGPTTRLTTPSNAPKWDVMYAASRRRIATNGRPTTGPSVDHDALLAQIRQGPLNDCYLLAVTGAMIHRDGTPPAAWLKSRSADGTVKARFADGSAAVTVPPLTTPELALGGMVDSGGGRWLTELEEAFGHHRAAVMAADDPARGHHRRGHRRDQPRRQPRPVHDRHDRPRLRGDPPRAHRRPPPGRPGQAAPAAPAPDLTAALAQHRLAVVGVAQLSSPGPDALPSPPDITHNHVYTVLAYDPAADVLTLWNPHGQAFTPVGPPGLAHGYPTEHGRFSLPLAQAFQFIGGFYFEQARPPAADDPGF